MLRFGWRSAQQRVGPCVRPQWPSKLCTKRVRREPNFQPDYTEPQEVAVDQRNHRHVSRRGLRPTMAAAEGTILRVTPCKIALQ